MPELGPRETPPRHLDLKVSWSWTCGRLSVFEVADLRNQFVFVEFKLRRNHHFHT